MKPEDRKVQLGLTMRWAQMVMTLFRNEIKRRKRQLSKSSFKPPAGSFDANQMRVVAFEDMLHELSERYAAILAQSGREAAIEPPSDLVLVPRNDVEIAAKVLSDQGFRDCAAALRAALGGVGK